MTKPKKKSPIQYRDCWIVAGLTGQDRIHIRILADTGEQARAIALRLYPQLVIGQCYYEGRVMDPERNRDIMED